MKNDLNPDQKHLLFNILDIVKQKDTQANCEHCKKAVTKLPSISSGQVSFATIDTTSLTTMEKRKIKRNKIVYFNPNKHRVHSINDCIQIELKGKNKTVMQS